MTTEARHHEHSQTGTSRIWLLLLCLAGIVFRLRQYFYSKSMWLDELSLASQIIKRSFSDLLLSPLGHHQVAPPGYLVLTKLSVLISGKSEYSLRAISILAGITGVIIAWRMADKIFHTQKARAAFICLVGLSPILALYSAEGKQYGVDACITLLIVAITAQPGPMVHRWKSLLLTGVLAVLFSHPSVFVLFAAGILMLMEPESRANGRARLTALGVPAVWAAIFIFMLCTSLESSSGDSRLQRYWRHAFSPLPITSLEDLRWYGSFLLNLMQVSFGVARRYGNGTGTQYFAGANILLSLLMAAGAWRLFAINRRLALMAGLTFLTIILASSFHLYPLRGRLLIFVVPFVYLCTASAFEYRFKSGALLSFAGAVILTLTHFRAATEGFVSPYNLPDAKSVMQCAAEQMQENDMFLIPRSSMSTFAFYRDRYKMKRINTRNLANISPTKAAGKKGLTKTLGMLQYRGGRWWIFIFQRVQRTDANLRPVFERNKIIATCTATGAKAYLLDAGTPAQGLQQ